MKYLIIILLNSQLVFANCKEVQYRFGDLVRIKASSYAPTYDEPGFVVGLIGEVVNKTVKEYKTDCRNNTVITVSVCTKNKTCYNFSVCEQDVERVAK